jgi:hypothetical protein
LDRLAPSVVRAAMGGPARVVRRASVARVGSGVRRGHAVRRGRLA